MSGQTTYEVTITLTVNSENDPIDWAFEALLQHIENDPFAVKDVTSQRMYTAKQIEAMKTELETLRQRWGYD